MSTKQDNVAVKFLKQWRGYNTGEVAGFPVETSERLINADVAEPFGKTGGKRLARAADGKKQVAQDDGASSDEKSPGAPEQDEDENTRP